MWSELTSLGHFQDSFHSSGILNARAIKESGFKVLHGFPEGFSREKGKD